MLKTTALIFSFLLLTVGLVLGSDAVYSKLHQTQQSLTTSNQKVDVSDSLNKSDSASPLKDQSIIKNLAPPTFFPGFDWRLPDKTRATQPSGFIAEVGGNTPVVKNHFIIVKWNESNPHKGQYDFTRLEQQLNRIAPHQALIRLEVNSSCEAPTWAMQTLRQSKQKSLVFWDKAYLDATRPFIQRFAQRFASHPQIIGVQLGLADGEFSGSCDNYDNKDGWGEFWMSPDERQEAENHFGFNPDVFEQASFENIKLYANAFGSIRHKLAFTNFGTLFSYGEGAKPYNAKLKNIASYVLANGMGNRDGAIERWMSYTDKSYGNILTSMPDGSCRLDFNEDYAQKIAGRYWGTENEFYGRENYILAEGGPYHNAPYRFLISSLRALQMRRNFMSIGDMSNINDANYKTQGFMQYLSLTMGKQIENTPDAFVLLGERYIATYRLADHQEVTCVNHSDSVKVRSFGRWLTESPENIQTPNKPALKTTMPASENKWYQSFYLPKDIDYEYFARESTRFSFDVNDQLSRTRCKNGCEVKVKATFKDVVKTQLHVQVAEGRTRTIQTTGDNQIKTVTFTITSQFNNTLGQDTDIRILSEQNIPLILLRMNLLN